MKDLLQRAEQGFADGSGNRKMYFIRRVENVWLSS